jgi:hypothetical protein
MFERFLCVFAAQYHIVFRNVNASLYFVCALVNVVLYDQNRNIYITICYDLISYTRTIILFIAGRGEIHFLGFISSTFLNSNGTLL